MPVGTVSSRARAQLRGHVVLCGLEALGVRTLEELVRLGERVVVIARDPEPHHRVAAERHAVHILDGDPTDPDDLKAAGVERARAIVLTADADIGNLHAGLAATALNPSLHVVIRVFDEELGRSFEELIPGCVTLSASALAAPGFVSAVLDSGHHRRLELLGRDLAIQQTDPSDPMVLAALADESGPQLELFPAHPGPAALCLVDASDEPRPARVTTSRSGRRRRVVVPRVSALRRVDRRFWALTLVIVALVAVSAVALELITGMDPIDAVYEALRGVIGSPTDDFLTSRSLQLMALVLTIVGAILLAAFYGLIVDVILSARITNFLGPHPTDARDHVIVVGLGTIGYRVAVDLVEQGVDVVAAEMKADGRFTDAARSHGIATVVTNGRSPETLRTLRIDRARAVIAATDDDAANMATALHARAARPDLRVVVRLFDADLAARLDRSFGGFETRSVSALAAPAFASAAIGRTVLATIPVGVGRVLIIASVPVEPGSAADGSSIAEEEDRASRVERGGCRVLAVAEADRVAWKPVPERRLDAGDELVVVATRSGLAKIVQRTESTPSVNVGEREGSVVLTLELPVIGRVDVPSLEEATRRIRSLVG